MRVIRLIAIVLLVYVGIVVVFEALLGIVQPAGGTTLVITTADEDGTEYDRVLSRLESDGRLYVAANHWPRAWYRRALENPNVQITLDGEKRSYVAVSVGQEENDRVDADNGLGTGFRVLTGFPPRYFVRLEPR